VVFGRKRSKDKEADERQPDQAGLVELLVGATDETERRRILLTALQTGEVRKSEVADLLKLVERLEAFQRPEPPQGDRN
jgi:hypothetical protein